MINGISSCFVKALFITVQIGYKYEFEEVQYYEVFVQKFGAPDVNAQSTLGPRPNGSNAIRNWDTCDSVSRKVTCTGSNFSNRHPPKQ